MTEGARRAILLAQQWAAAGVDPVHAMRREHDYPDQMSVEEAWALIRGAYGAGYTDALTSDEPLTILEAGRRAACLRLTLPT